MHSGFSVITGETGAGKSIILGALNMLLGHRADAKSVKEGTQRCIIEAHFDVSGYGMKAFFDENELDYDENDCILRREMTAAGKSRAFINDTPVPLTVMRSLGEQLVDIHSQHQNLLLSDSDFQLSVLDILAQNQETRLTFHKAYTEYKNAERKLQEMKEQMNHANEQEDYLRFQYNELHEANLTDGEQEELEELSERINHTEDIKAALYRADNALNGEEYGIISQLKTASNSISSITSIYSDADEISERISSCYIELQDLSSEISSLLNNVDFDPREQERINERLDIIYSLQRKHHCEDVTSLINLRDSIHEKLQLIDNSDEAINEQETLVENLRLKATEIAAKLTKQRQKVADLVSKEMKKRLILLGIPKVQFYVDIKTTDLNKNGVDAVTFFFSANSSTSPQPVAQVASGGEIARVMLSLKAMISNAVSMPTIIFDEIDTGVSGKIAEAMAVIMSEMGNAGRQVVSITHLPQIASRGKHHYKVAKKETADGTKSQMMQLTYDERVAEIAQMLSGSTISDAALEQARQLLKITE